MKRLPLFVYSGFTALALVAGAPSRASATGIVLYDSLPSSLPPNLPSLGYQAMQTSELGQAITLATGGVFDLTVTVAMSNWALESTYEAVGTSTGFTVPLTLSLFNNPGNGSDPGAAFATQTVNALIPWRPEATAGCGTAYDSGGTCYNGALSLVSFSFSGVNLPGTLVYGLKFNTQTYGPNPIGTDGPYNSLNFGLVPAGSASVGSDIVTAGNSLYWQTATAGWLTNPANVNTFSRDSGWDYTPAAEFIGNDVTAADAVPEPGSMLLLGTGLVGLVAKLRSRRKLSK